MYLNNKTIKDTIKKRLKLKKKITRPPLISFHIYLFIEVLKIFLKRLTNYKKFDHSLIRYM